MIKAVAGLHLVVGMHRSGTSVVARLLKELGANFGLEDDSLPPKADNPDGFWESASFVQINDDLFAAMGGSWDEPPGVANQVELAESDLGCRARKLVSARMDETGTWFVKDPRASLLIPFWRAIEHRGRTIVCLRDPMSSAASLDRRNGISMDKGTRLWLRYTTAALAHAVDPLVVLLDTLLAEPEDVARALAGALLHGDVSGKELATAVGVVEPSKVFAGPSGRGSEPVSILYELLHSESVDGYALAVAIDGSLDQSDKYRVELNRARIRERSMAEEREQARGAFRDVEVRERRLLENRDAVVVERDTARGAFERSGAKVERLRLELAENQLELASVRTELQRHEQAGLWVRLRGVKPPDTPEGRT